MIATKLGAGQAGEGINCGIFIEWNFTQQYKGTITDACNNMDILQKHYSE